MDAGTSQAPDTDDAPDARRSRLAVVCLVASAGLVLAGVVGFLDPFGLVWVDRLLDHPFAFGALAAALFGYGAALRVDRLWAAVLLATPCLLGAMGWASYGFFWTDFFGTEEIAAVAAPDGEGAAYEVVVTAVPVITEDAYVVSVRQTGSPLARQWEVGCLAEDPTFHQPISWTDRDEFVMTTVGGRVPVDVDARTGRPARVEGYPWNQCPED